MNNIFIRCWTSRMCQGCRILSRILTPYLSWMTCASTGGSLSWWIEPWARRWSTPPRSWMGGSSCNTESLDAPPVAWGATSKAPDKSTRYRTGDWQCTVNRTGLDPVASAMAVELLVSLLYRSLGANALAPAPGRRWVGGATAGEGTFSPGLGGGQGGGGSMP